MLNGHGTPAYSICDQMPWYNEAAEVSYDPEAAAALLDEAGWGYGPGRHPGRRTACARELTLLYASDDSVRQALAADLANQLGALGIDAMIEGVGWDTAYDRALSDPLIWGWGAHTPMELYNILSHRWGHRLGPLFALCQPHGGCLHGCRARQHRSRDVL